MGYRNIFIEGDCKLSVKNSNLMIKNIYETIIPIDDINAIIVDNRMCNLSTYLIDELSKKSVLLYICNEKHLPTTILMNINSYCRQLKRMNEQFNISKPLKKRLWQSIIIQKILNQANCLKILGINEYKILENYAESVQSGDSTNVEACAAMIYFKSLFGNRFTRRSDSIINSALNYGYSIVRGMIARSLVSYGFETSIGIFHHNELNNFNLADDLIEPFRPLVDLYIISVIPESADSLSSQIKRDILNVTNQLMIIDNKKYNIQNAIEVLVSSLSNSYRNEINNLVLPELIVPQEYKFL